ncbi:MAG: flippase [Desulfobacteraceae bacterium]|nr:flippase [Desulfobacteraceae bacterium]
MSKPVETTLNRGSLLAQNTIWNLIGDGAPLLVALFAIPPLINGLGTDRFGVLTLAWMVIGYFSLFDLGLGRALTKLVAEKLGSGQEEEIPSLAWTALFLMLLFSFAGAVILGLLSPWLVRNLLKIPEGLHLETLHTFYLLAASIPCVISTSGLRGILEAKQRFDLVNALRIPMGVITFLGPLLVLPFSQSLLSVVAVLVVARLLFFLSHLLIVLYVMPTLRQNIKIRRVVISPLIRLGSWMTVSNIVGPLMVYLDRFLIGGMVSVAAVAYYATPYEVVTKLLIIPKAVISVLFPAFAFSFVQSLSHIELLFTRSTKYLFLILFPVILLIVTLAPECLSVWLGNEFALNSARVLRWLAIGVFINSHAQIPFALVQSAGRPDLTAKLHLVELPFYLIGVWWLIGLAGIEGAAIAWVARVVVDTAFLFFMAWRLLKTSTFVIWRISLTAGVALLILAIATLPVNLPMKGLFVLATLFVFGLTAWFLILAQDERLLIQHRLKAAIVFD